MMKCIYGDLTLSVGQFVYVVDTSNKKVSKQEISSIHIEKDFNNSCYFFTTYQNGNDAAVINQYRKRRFSQIGKTIFFTYDEAKVALNNILQEG